MSKSFEDLFAELRSRAVTRPQGSGTVRALDAGVHEIGKKVENWEGQFSSERSALYDRISNGERCVGFREEVAKAFSDAKSNARSESDSEIKAYAERLISKWESQEPGHATAIRNYKEAVEKCKRMK